jgi:hypothetical protein
MFFLFRWSMFWGVSWFASVSATAMDNRDAAEEKVFYVIALLEFRRLGHPKFLGRPRLTPRE